MYEAGHKFAVEALGLRRGELLAELAKVEKDLHHEMRLLREDGASQVEVMAASGYRSIDAVRKILDPAVKAGAAQARKRRREQPKGWNFSMPEMGIGESGGCGKIRLDHVAPPHGPYCQLEAGHEGECQFPSYPINHPHDSRGRCVTDGSAAP